MFGIDIVELSAVISKRLTRWSPLEIKVTKVINKSTFEIAPATPPFRYYDFWSDAHGLELLTPEEKMRIYLRIHRSTDSNDHVFALVSALKQFCDTGMPLQYEQDKVVDIWVINADAFDVSDLTQTRSLKMRDADSGVTMQFPITLEGMDAFSNVRTDVRKRFRLSGVDISAAERCKRMENNKSYENTTPHWWVAAIVESNRNEIRERRMVHIDVCGAAYDDMGFRFHRRSLISLQVFTTPEYSLVPGEKYLGVTEGDVSKKFFMTSTHVEGQGGLQQSSLQPYSLRHFRCSHREGDSPLGITDVNTFLEYGQSSFLGNPAEWSRIIAELRHGLVLRVPVGTEVFLCNLVQRSDLNERNGYVHLSASTHPSIDRIPVQVEDVEGVDVVNVVFMVKTSCLCFTKSKGYSSFSELSMRVQRDMEAAQESTEILQIEGESTSTELSQTKQTVMDELVISFAPGERNSKNTDLQEFTRSLSSDPEMSAAFLSLRPGMITGKHLLSPRFVNGVRTLNSLPFVQNLPREMLTILTGFVEVIDHPKFPEATKILKICKNCKERAMQQSGGEETGDRELDTTRVSQFYRLLSSVAEKIKADEQLSEIFNMIGGSGFFPNPVKQVSHLEGELLSKYMLCL